MENKIKKLGLLLGTFDPIHIGHIELIVRVLNGGHVEKVYIVPTPGNPWKDHKPVSFELRCYMIRHLIKKEIVDAGLQDKVGFITGAFCEYNPIDLADPEDGKYYSYLQLARVKEELGPMNEYYIIGGTDVAESVKGWKKSEEILKEFHLLGMDRAGYVDFPEGGPSIKVSSTNIREMIMAGKSTFPWLMPSTIDIIHKYRLYERK